MTWLVSSFIIALGHLLGICYFLFGLYKNALGLRQPIYLKALTLSRRGVKGREGGGGGVGMDGSDFFPTTLFIYFKTLIGVRLVRHMVAENLCQQMEMYEVF